MRGQNDNNPTAAGTYPKDGGISKQKDSSAVSQQTYSDEGTADNVT